MLSTPIENDIPDLPSPIPELVESFRKLMLDVSGDAATLSAINPVTEMQQDRTDMPSHLLSLEKKSQKF